MKILNIAMSAPFTEGYSYQDNLLTEYQHKLGHDVTLLTGLETRDNHGKKIQVVPCDKIMINGVRLIRISSGNIFSRIMGYTPAISRIISQIEPDLIFIHGLCNFTAVPAIRYKRKNPDTILVADNHQDEFNFNYKKFPFNFLLPAWRYGWKRWTRHFNHIYGTTSWRRDFAVEHYGIPRDKADVLLLGVDTDNILSDPDKARSSIRRQLDIADDSFVFIHGGKMCSGKKTIELMKAFSMIDDNNTCLLLFGAVDDDIKFEFQHHLQRDSRIKYIGYIDSKIVHDYFYASDFGMFPGGHSVLWEEAIGCRLPSVFRAYSNDDHTNLCGNSISISGDAGINEIYDTMMKVLKSPDYYSQLREKAIEASESLSYYEIAKKSIRK